MKKKKGFTLIELLAIIVILAVIAVITVPIILGIVDEAKEKAAVDSAYGYKDSIANSYLSSLLNDSDQVLNGNYMVTDGRLGELNIPFSGTAPTTGSLIYENNKLVSGCLTINGYKIEFQDGKFVSLGKGECDGGVTLYYSYDINATEGDLGFITDKRYTVDPSWDFYIKEKTGPKKGYSTFYRGVYDPNLTFETYNECTAEIENIGAPDYATLECIKPYAIQFIQGGEPQTSPMILDNQKCQEVLNSTAPELIEEMQAQCTETSFYTIVVSIYEADENDFGLYDTMQACESSSYITDYNENPADYSDMSLECRPYNGSGTHTVNELCGVENGNTFCIKPNNTTNNINTLDNIYNSCSDIAGVYTCEGSAYTVKDDINKIKIESNDTTATIYCQIDGNEPYCYAHSSTAYFASGFVSKLSSTTSLSNIYKFLRANSIDSAHRTNTYKVSDDSLSEDPIYMWYNSSSHTVYWYSEANDIRFVDTSLNGLFYYANNLTDISGLADWNISNVTNISYMFYQASKLSDISPIASWNTGNVDNMSFLFANTAITNVNSVSGWDTDSLTNMSHMFYYTESLNDISGLSGWNTGGVTTMDYLFHYTTNLSNVSPIANWNTGSVTNMQYMFQSTSSLTDASSLHWVIKNNPTANVFGGMFNGSGVTTSYPTFYSDDNKTQVINGTWSYGTFVPSS